MKKITNYLVAVILLAVITTGCKTKVEVSATAADNEYILMSTLYQQKAAERRALSYQAFNLATLRLNNQLRIAGLTKTLAVVVDIDETVLDNSPFEAKSILKNSNYPTYWNEWCELAEAQPLAGAVEFLTYAQSVGAEVYYITNRKVTLLEPTIKNLKDKGFPYADKEHVLMRTDDSNKESRRQKVAANHYIFLLMGDNLGDFMHVFDNAPINERFSLTDKYKDEFGKRFIVLPNPMYGTWANLLFNNNFKLSKEERISLMKKQLISF